MLTSFITAAALWKWDINIPTVPVSLWLNRNLNFGWNSTLYQTGHSDCGYSQNFFSSFISSPIIRQDEAPRQRHQIILLLTLSLSLLRFASVILLMQVCGNWRRHILKEMVVRMSVNKSLLRKVKEDIHDVWCDMYVFGSPHLWDVLASRSASYSSLQCPRISLQKEWIILQ